MVDFGALLGLPSSSLGSAYASLSGQIGSPRTLLLVILELTYVQPPTFPRRSSPRRMGFGAGKVICIEPGNAPCR